MLVSFFESIKYVGHLIPLSILRIYVGYYYFTHALGKYHGDFLFRPRLAEDIAEMVPKATLYQWYKSLIDFFFIHHWQGTSFIITGIEFAIGISFILGYVVRPMALVASFLSLNLIFILNQSSNHSAILGSLELNKILFVVHLTFALIGAGRTLGMDYYYFKRRRGFWW